MTPSEFTVIAFHPDNGQIVSHHVNAADGLNAFAALASNPGNAELEMVVAIPGHLTEDDLDFPGESLVDAGTVLDQPDVYGKPPTQVSPTSADAIPHAEPLSSAEGQKRFDKLAAHDRATRFMAELLGSVETLSAIAETHGVQTLADLMYLQSAILEESFIDLCRGNSHVLDVVRELPSQAEWCKYIHTDSVPEARLKTWEDLGYEANSTGGGFVAYFKYQGNVQVVVTCSDTEARLPSPKDRVDIGFYNAVSGEPLPAPSGFDGFQSSFRHSLSQPDGLLYIEKQLAQLSANAAPKKQKQPRPTSLGM